MNAYEKAELARYWHPDSPRRLQAWPSADVVWQQIVVGNDDGAGYGDGSGDGSGGGLGVGIVNGLSLGLDDGDGSGDGSGGGLGYGYGIGDGDGGGGKEGRIGDSTGYGAGTDRIDAYTFRASDGSRAIVDVAGYGPGYGEGSGAGDGAGDGDGSGSGYCSG